MRTRKQHIAHVSTQEAVSNAKSGSWAATAVRLGFDAKMGTTLSDVARGKPSAVTPEGENLIRAALGLPILPLLTIAACPTCGGDHNLRGIPDCHGAPVAAVVTLALGQRVAAARKPPQVRTLSDYPVAVLSRMIAQREPYTQQC
jgi:hypothetical protein